MGKLPRKKTMEEVGLESTALGMSGMNSGEIFEHLQTHDQNATRMADVLPLKGSSLPEEEAELIKLGFKLGEKVDEIFREAELPKGWTKKPTEHHMYTHLIDDKGRVRGQIGYKGAIYDRWGSLSMYPRYHIEDIYLDPSSGAEMSANASFKKDHDVAVAVKDRAEGKQLFRTDSIVYQRSGRRSLETYDGRDKLQAEALKWVKENCKSNDWD